jgi:hypothetical protein
LFLTPSRPTLPFKFFTSDPVEDKDVKDLLSGDCINGDIIEFALKYIPHPPPHLSLTDLHIVKLHQNFSKRCQHWGGIPGWPTPTS